MDYGSATIRWKCLSCPILWILPPVIQTCTIPGKEGIKFGECWHLATLIKVWNVLKPKRSKYCYFIYDDKIRCVCDGVFIEYRRNWRVRSASFICCLRQSIVWHKYRVLRKVLNFLSVYFSRNLESTLIIDNVLMSLGRDTGWQFHSFKTSCWLQNKSSALVWPGQAKAELEFWSQREVLNEWNGRPVLTIIIDRIYRNE